MKAFLVLGALIVTPISLGFHTLGESGEGNAETFSEKFRPAYTADQSKPEAVTKLEEMHENYPRSEEIAEIELTLGVIYGQRTGMVEPVKAGLHFTKALEGHRSGPGRSNPDAMAQPRLIRIEQETLMHRYYHVDAVKRIAKHEKLTRSRSKRRLPALSATHAARP